MVSKGLIIAGLIFLVIIIIGVVVTLVVLFNKKETSGGGSGGGTSGGGTSGGGTSGGSGGGTSGGGTSGGSGGGTSGGGSGGGSGGSGGGGSGGGETSGVTGPLPPSNYNLCYSEKSNPLKGKIIASDQCLFDVDEWKNKLDISVWENKLNNNALVKFNVWKNSSNDSYYIIPDSDKSVTSSTSGWEKELSFFAPVSNISGNNLEKYNVFVPGSNFYRSIISINDSVNGWTKSFSFYGQKQPTLPTPDLYLCYYEIQNPERGYIYERATPDCPADATDWRLKYTIPVYNTPNSLTTQYKIWNASVSGISRGRIRKSDLLPNPGGWNEQKTIYAFDSPLPGTDKYCLMSNNSSHSSGTQTKIIKNIEECVEEGGWTNSEDGVLYAPRLNT
jgi:hypothetical protein